METLWSFKAVSGIRFSTRTPPEKPSELEIFEHQDPCRRPSVPEHNLCLAHWCANAKKGRRTNNDFPPAVRRVWIVRVCIVRADSFGMWGGVVIGWGGIRCEVEQKGKGAGQSSCAEQVLHGLK